MIHRWKYSFQDGKQKVPEFIKHLHYFGSDYPKEYKWDISIHGYLGVICTSSIFEVAHCVEGNLIGSVQNAFYFRSVFFFIGKLFALGI